MGIPILTSEGFVGQRWIIDDYFQAGETLHAGDVVGVKQDGSNNARVYKLDSGEAPGRVIGVVHTPASGQLGDIAASYSAGSPPFVTIVLQGVAKALSGGAISVGDSVIPAISAGIPPGKTSSVARVVQGLAHEHSPGNDGQTGTGEGHNHQSGNVLPNGFHSHEGTGNTGGESSHTHEGGGGNHDHEIGSLTSGSVLWTDPSYQRSLRLSKGGGHDAYVTVGGVWGDEGNENLRTGSAGASASAGGGGTAHSHSSGPVASAGSHAHVGAGYTSTESVHKHAVGSEDRAVVVGKCLTRATAANQVIDILVDIAG